EMRLKTQGLRGGTATSTPAPRGEMEKILRMQGLRGNAATSTPMMRGQEMRKAQEELRKHARDARLQKMIQKMTVRFSAAIRREEKLADRIASRLDKAAQNGKDVSLLRQKLVDARLKIADAKTALDVAVAKLQAAIASSDAKNMMKDVTHAFADVTAKLKAAHAALVNVITLLKGIGNTATTTPQNP
ncbi:hypothetical protein KGQ34_04475, partial [Patescibacteria group bacterium]|nr:hypothetical protein [Patescibacteria group bacterium]